MSRTSNLPAACLSAFMLMPANAGTAAASSTIEAPPVTSSPSQIDFTATLSLSAVQQRLRSALSAVLRESPAVAQTHRQSGVTLTVTPGVRAERLVVTGRSDGALLVGLPVDVAVNTSFSGGTGLAVGAVGCAPTRFDVQAVFSPLVSADGRLGYSLRSVGNDNERYECRIASKGVVDAGKHVKEFFGSGFGLGRKADYSKAVNVDVSAKIQRRLRDFARSAFAARVDDFNTLMPDDRVLAQLLQRPAVFGNALTLGIDHPRVRVTRVTATGDAYRVSGVLEGYPRLVFGGQWGQEPGGTGAAAAAPGFRLPARLLFPTDPGLLPDRSPQAASGCLGGFRLRRVPARHDLAVLQRCGAVDGNANVIWLSGDDEAPRGKVHAYDRPMANVLGEIIDWLGDQSLWGDVGGAAVLHREMIRTRERLLAFQRDTRIPVDDRGAIHFAELSVDLHRVWVTDEAIQADVVLRGNARLAVRLTL